MRVSLRERWEDWLLTGGLESAGQALLATLVGLGVGVLLIATAGLKSNWRGVLLLVPIILCLTILYRNLEHLILVAIALGIPLNLDFSLIISPYSRNPQNIVAGYRTLVALTELRISIVTVALLVGYLLWLIPRPHGHPSRLLHLFPRTTVPMLAFLFFTIISAFNAQDSELAFFRIVSLLQVTLAYFYLINHLSEKITFRFYWMIALLGLLAESILIILQWTIGLNFEIFSIATSEFGAGRLAGTFGNTGPAGGYLSAMTLLAFATLWAVREKYQRLLAAAAFLVGVIALLGTGSRIAWVAFGFTMISLVVLLYWRKWLKFSTLAALAVAGVLMLAVVSPVLLNRLAADDQGSAQARPMMWRLAWRVIQAHPWLGVGAGNYALVTRDYFTEDIGIADEVIDRIVHNTYLAVWAESGIFGILSFIGMLAGALIEAWTCLRARDRQVSVMGAASGMAIAALAIQMVTGTFHTQVIVTFMWTVLALPGALASQRLGAIAPTLTEAALHRRKSFAHG